MEGGAPDDDEEEEAAAGVGRACGVSEARSACLAPALWSRERGDAEAVEGTDLGGVGGGKSGGAGEEGEEEEERGVSSGAGRGGASLRCEGLCAVCVSEAPCCARAAEGAPGVLALRVHFGDVWVARAQILEAVHIEG